MMEFHDKEFRFLLRDPACWQVHSKSELFWTEKAYIFVL